MFGLFMTEKRRHRKLDELSEKIGDAKKALMETRTASFDGFCFRRYLKTDIANWQRKIDKLKGKK